MRDWTSQCSIDIARQLEEAARAKQRAAAERWRRELRPRAVRQLAARAATLTWSRRFIRLLLDELHTDDLFRQIVPRLDCLPARRYPQAVAVALALRHSWRRDDLTRFARRLGIALTPDQQPSKNTTRTKRSRGRR